MATSTKPKGATNYKRSFTTYKETAFGILPRIKVVQLENKGVAKALKYIFRLSSKKVKIAPKLICDIHKKGFGFIFPDWAGKFRTIDVTVGEFEPPHSSKVPELFKSLCDDLEERLNYIPPTSNEKGFLQEVVSLLSWFQHRFVWIHPFFDYNGRLARLVTNLIALNLGLPIITIRAETGKDRENYIDAMKAADKHDLSQLEKLIADGLKESLEKV